jgi:predicted unusual protein kinase regulating ubiquinone biosynthesis (AarF/ABC1/UbiB family)
MSSKSGAPRSSFVRGSILGAAVARASVKKAGQLLTQPFRPEVEKAHAEQQSDEQIAKVLFDACSTLRGTPLKLVQVLATEQELLPEAYRAQFALASYQVEPINRALVTRLLRVELGEPSSLFRQFDDVPFASASLGQVHAATSLCGNSLAVKLQYPGVSTAVDSDLRLIRAVLRRTSLRSLFESCYGELRERLTEELDYRCEAANAKWFREHLSLTGVVVPRVYPEYTTKHVIATERLAGLHAIQYLATGPSQEERNRYGQLLVDLFHHCVYRLGCIHADPNFGNYLFLDDGKLGLIDYGCVRRLDAKFVQAFRHFMANETLDNETVQRLLDALGLECHSQVDSRELYDFFAQWREWLLEPYRTMTFDYSRNEEYFARGFQMGERARRFLGHCRYRGAFLYFGRAHHGLHRLLQCLSAKVCFAKREWQ